MLPTQVARSTWQSSRLVARLALVACVAAGCGDGGSEAARCTTPGALAAGATFSADGLDWVELPGCSFAIGCAPDDENCDNDEMPQHRVVVDGFALNVTLVTQAQYRRVTGQAPSAFATCGDDCPVESVDWSAARAFCAAVGGRLPSEAEYEYALRAGGDGPWVCGADPACRDAAMWYADNAGESPHPVATKLPNRWGLYDMAGNVWEWNEDCYHDSFRGAPSDGRAWVEAGCSHRMVRGGAYDIYLDGNLRVWGRTRFLPDESAQYIGFRCARDLP
ncbi:MAG: formylglycine-generating enzyme family protein [Myxococcota bacterium]